jgi:RNA polymerase sigma-70 factor (ECF subfamily)
VPSKPRDGVSFLPGAAGERALVARLAAGENAAYRECYDLHAPGLMRVLVRVLRNQALAEEILQETFVAAFRSIGTFRGETRLATWLAGIGVRRALNELRGQSRRTKHLPPAPEGEEPGSSPEPWLVDRDETRQVLAILDGMAPAKRLALLLQAEGHTAAEIAAITGEPRGTILSRLARSRAELAERAAAAGLVRSAASARKEVRR